MGQSQSNAYNCSTEGANAEPRKGAEPTCSNSGSPSKSNEHHVRKLSIVSNRNIQLLSMRPRSEKETFADTLKGRRRSSLINLILGAPSSGPRFCDDLCSLNSRNFGIEFFPDKYQASPSVSSLRLESIEDLENGDQSRSINHKRRRSSIGSITIEKGNLSSPEQTPDGEQQLQLAAKSEEKKRQLAPSVYAQQARQHFKGKSSLASTLASIDLTSSLDKHDSGYNKQNGRSLQGQLFRPSLGQDVLKQNLKTRLASGRVNQSGRVLRRTGSELSLYSTTSSGSQHQGGSLSSNSSLSKKVCGPMRETKLIIIMQVCIPFILAGFGNMGAGLILNKVAEWKSFHSVPIFFVLLPPFIGLKGNLEMTLASRLSTLSNLNLLETNYQKRRAFVSNLVLVLGQAIGLSIFAAALSVGCELIIGHSKIVAGTSSLWEISLLVVLASALATSVVLVLVSAIIMSCAVGLARLVQVNPDNLSTLIAAVYGDISCVLVYGLIADKMFTLREQNDSFWPITILVSVLTAWPMLMYAAHKFEETSHITLTSIPPLLTSIIVSMGSGAVLSMFIGRFHLVALYQPVVNGFGANLIAVQASRVSTWLWCNALRNMSTNDEAVSNKTKKTLASMVSFSESVVPNEKKTVRFEFARMTTKAIKTVLWSFFNSSPNSTAARLLLAMMIPAHTIYFFVIILLSPSTSIVITWQFYSIYIGLCLAQVFILLTICEPLMTFLMKHDCDPDIFGISLLMALADLTGTLCLAGAFTLLAGIGDPNAQ